MLRKFFNLRKGQKGFTLIEILVAIAITGIIGSAISMAITQVFSVSIADRNRMEAVKQVENALHYINRDAQMAWSSKIVDDNPSMPSFPLNLQWKDYTVTPSQDNQVQYILESNGDLKRVHNIDGTTIVAHHIVSASNYTFDGQVLTITLTASVEGYKSAVETRTLQVQPRVY